MSTVKVLNQGPVVVLELNRPEALNAMNVEMLVELARVLDEVSKNDCH